MRLTRLRGACDPKPTCPTLYLTDQGTLIVQGWIVTSTAMHVPPGEAAVEVPVCLLWVPPAAVPSENSSVVSLTGRDTALVRGQVIDDPAVLAHLSPPEGETVVEVSASLLPEVIASAQ